MIGRGMGGAVQGLQPGESQPAGLEPGLQTAPGAQESGGLLAGWQGQQGGQFFGGQNPPGQWLPGQVRPVALHVDPHGSAGVQTQQDQGA